MIHNSFCSLLVTDLSKSDTKVSTMKWNNPTPVSVNQLEVAVDTSYEQYPTSQTNETMLGVGTQQGDKPHELSIGSDLESVTETGIAK